MGAKEITVREQTADVRVLRATELVRWLRRQKPRMEPERVEEMAATMSRRDTWTAATAVPDVGVEFIALLQREVAAAKAVRILWAAGSLLILVSIAAPLAFDLYTRALGI